jgi:hypothetical protein
MSAAFAGAQSAQGLHALLLFIEQVLMGDGSLAENTSDQP